jgi:hypothetical protein
VKISRPVPEKPISEAMQQGKEPLRSFGDLMQFLKKPSPAPEIPPSAPTSNEPPASTEPPANSNPEEAEPQEPKADDV